MLTRKELIVAICAGNHKIILRVLTEGTKPNISHRGRPLLIWAIQERQLAIVRTLVRAGALLEKKDESGFTPLAQAVGEGDIKIVSFLLKSGANVNQCTCNGTALHMACAYRRLNIAKLLLTYGANVGALDDEGQTPSDLIGKQTNTTDKKLQKILSEAQSTPKQTQHQHRQTKQKSNSRH